MPARLCVMSFDFECVSDTKWVNPNPGSFDRKVFGQNKPSADPAAMRVRDQKQASLTDAHYISHNCELLRRLRWCIENGPTFWPAHQHVHKAPGDDRSFAFGVPPWHRDGSVNSLGIPDQRCVEPPMPGFELPVDYDSKAGFNCKKCQQWVPIQPRPYENGIEPEDWWWCLTCRKNKPKLTAKQKQILEESKTLKDIRMWTKP